MPAAVAYPSGTFREMRNDTPSEVVVALAPRRHRRSVFFARLDSARSGWPARSGRDNRWGRSCRCLLSTRAANRQRQHGAEAGRVVLQAHGGAVQAGGGGDEAQPQAAAGERAALLEAHEPLQRALAV